MDLLLAPLYKAKLSFRTGKEHMFHNNISSYETVKIQLKFTLLSIITYVEIEHSAYSFFLAFIKSKKYR